jgi:hypothetical protein
MNKGIVALLVLFSLMASCVIVAEPALSSADVTENTWASKAPMKVARFGLGVAVVNGKIYAIGGSTRSGGGGTRRGSLPVTGGVVGTNEEYDPATDKWTVKAPMPTPRSLLEANVVNGKIYLIGGDSNGTLNEVYDPATDTWTTKAPMPTASYGYASAVVDSKIYIIDSNLNQIYDPETDTWSQSSSPPSHIIYGKAGATMGVNAPKRIYVLGEISGQLEDEPPYFVRVYDPKNDVWTFGADIPTHRYDFGVAVVNDMLYVIGGYTSSYPDMPYSYPYGPSNKPYATNEQYTPFGYGTVPPAVNVVSPKNENYTSSNVSLAFTVNKPAQWMGYSLDGQETVTVTENITLTALSNGLHNITVFANDTFGNSGASETVTFSIAEAPATQEPFPTMWIATAVVLVAIGGIAAAIYYSKKKPKNTKYGEQDNKLLEHCSS